MSIPFVLLFRYYLFWIRLHALMHVLLICYSLFLINYGVFRILFFLNTGFVAVFICFQKQNF